MGSPIVVDTRLAVKQIQREFKTLSKDRIRLATARAINHTATKARNQSVREIRNTYNLQMSSRALKQRVHVNKASRLKLVGQVFTQGRPLPIFAFKPRQTKVGVNVRILKGKKKTLKRVFIAQMRSGHKGAFFRGKYTSKTYVKSKKRLPITEAVTTSIPKAFGRDSIQRTLQREIQHSLPIRLTHELKRFKV